MLFDKYDYENMSRADLEAAIDQVSEILKSATEQFNKEQNRIVEIQRLMEPLLKELRQLKQAQDEKERLVHKLKPEIKEGRESLRRLQHELERAKMRELAMVELEAKFAEIDRETANARWREFAFAHQIDGAKRLALVNGCGILGDSRGLGKTLTSLILLDIRKSKKVVIFAPKETIKNFEEEIKVWAKDRTLISLASKSRQRRDFALDMLGMVDEFLVCINLEAWRRDATIINRLIEAQVDAVVIDEAHYLKNPESVAFTGVRRLVHARNMCVMCGKNDLHINEDKTKCHTPECNAVYDNSDYTPRSVKTVLPMTGTAILNNPGELWPLLNLIDPKSFPSLNHFIRDYCDTWGNRVTFKIGGEAALMKKIGPQYIRRDRKSAGIKIPPQKIQMYEIVMDPEKYARQLRAYKEMKTQWLLFSQDGEDFMSANAAITAILRMRQLVTWPMGIKIRHPKTGETIFECDVNESAKLDFAEELITELVTEENERVVVFSQFTAPLEELHRRLQKANVRSVLLQGNTSEAQRHAIREDFDAKTADPVNYRWDVVLANYRVGGQSINLTAASQMVVIDRQWNPGMEDQAFGRIDRIGQTESTTVHMLHCADSIDTWMNALHDAKKSIIDGFEDAHVNYAQLFLKGLQEGEI